MFNRTESKQENKPQRTSSGFPIWNEEQRSPLSTWLPFYDRRNPVESQVKRDRKQILERQHQPRQVKIGSAVDYIRVENKSTWNKQTWKGFKINVLHFLRVDKRV